MALPRNPPLSPGPVSSGPPIVLFYSCDSQNTPSLLVAPSSPSQAAGDRGRRLPPPQWGQRQRHTLRPAACLDRGNADCLAELHAAFGPAIAGSVVGVLCSAFAMSSSSYCDRHSRRGRGGPCASPNRMVRVVDAPMMSTYLFVTLS